MSYEPQQDEWDNDKKNILISIDCETGGLDAKNTSILELGAVKFQIDPKEKYGIEIIETFQCYILEPILRVTPGAMAVNKIDLSKLGKEIPALNPYWAAIHFMDWVERNIDITKKKVQFVGNNAVFDFSYIKRLFLLAGMDSREGGKSLIPFCSHRFRDIVALMLAMGDAGLLDPGMNLKKLAKKFEIEFDEDKLHSALYDATLTAQVYGMLVSILRTNGLH